MQALLVPDRPAFVRTIRIILFPLIACAISPAQAQIESPAGTYIRVEAGAAFHQKVSFQDTSPGSANCDLCGAQFPSTIDQTFLVGGAFGYHLGPVVRFDLSVDYIGSAKVSGHSTAAVAATGSANLDSVVGLFNGYIDLPPTGVFGQVRPYIDAGIGIARNSLGTTSGNSGAVGPFTISGASHTNFAWAIGAGGGFPLTSRMTLDVSYRFLDVGQIRTDSTLSFGGMSVVGTPSRTGTAGLHEVTVGLRYDF